MKRQPDLTLANKGVNMKTVFSNAQTAHVWAQQTQSYGRSKNMFFEGNKIWSYGYHYPAAVIHIVKNQRIALVRSDTYSNSTSMHLNDIRFALRDNIPYLCVKNVNDLKLASKELDTIAYDSLKQPLKRLKVTNKDSINYEFERILDAFNDANMLRKLLGKVTIAPKSNDLDTIQTHLEKRLARYKELNTPEMIAKRESEAKKRALKKNSDAIAKFRQGERVMLPALPHNLLRVKDDRIQTSSGAEVPLKQGIALLKAIELNVPVEGLKIGHFTVERLIEQPDGDTLVKIGCHKILLSEAKEVLGKVA